MLIKKDKAFIDGFVTAVNYLKVAVGRDGIFDAEEDLDKVVRMLTNEYTLVNLASLVYDSPADMQAKYHERTDVFPHVGTQYMPVSALVRSDVYFDHNQENVAADVLSMVDLQVSNIEENISQAYTLHAWIQ